VTERRDGDVSDELDARRRILLSITDDSDREAVAAVFARVDWRRQHEAERRADDDEQIADLAKRVDWERFGLVDADITSEQLDDSDDDA
jgi:hypothetical protein